MPYYTFIWQGQQKQILQCHVIWVSNWLYWGNIIQGSVKERQMVSCCLLIQKKTNWTYGIAGYSVE